MAAVEKLLSEAERVAVWSAASAPVLTGKLKDVALAGTVMDVGVFSAGLLVERATTAPEAIAGLERVAVQVPLALEASVGNAHCKEETVTGAVRETVADWEEPLRDAVMVAV